VVRRRIRINVKNGTVVQGNIWLLVNDISAGKLRGVVDSGVQKGMVRTGHGVRIPGKSGGSYPDAFVAQGLGHNWQVFRRKGKSRLPIEAIKIPIRVQARAAIRKWVEASVPIAQAEIVRQLQLRKISASDAITDVTVLDVT
jgi:hypothetical protein